MQSEVLCERLTDSGASGAVVKVVCWDGVKDVLRYVARELFGLESEAQYGGELLEYVQCCSADKMIS
jgi:hypothetical protein